MRSPCPPGPRRPPAARCRRSRARAPPSRAIWRTGPASVVRRGAPAARPAGTSSIAHGSTATPTLPARGLGVVTTRPAGSTRTRSPRRRARRHAGEEVDAGEGGDEGRRRRPREVVHGPRLDDPALVDDDDAVGEADHVAEVVRDEDRRQPQLASQRDSSRETCALVTESSAESGSSSSRTWGDLPTARARATRWRSPPEICAGPCAGRAARCRSARAAPRPARPARAARAAGAADP